MRWVQDQEGATASRIQAGITPLLQIRKIVSGVID
jgi:hypothetical protein